MPTSTITSTSKPTLTPDDLDDLIYYARTGELSSLQDLLSSLSTSHSVPTSTILRSAVDVDSDGLGSQNCLLHYPAANGNVEVLTLLLNLLQGKKGDKQMSGFVNHQNVSGNTPLHWAALNGRVECVKVLVKAGAQAGLVNGVGHDAVFEAEMCEDPGRGRECVEWMLGNCAGLERGIGGERAQEAEEDVAEREEVERPEAGEMNGRSNEVTEKDGG